MKRGFLFVVILTVLALLAVGLLAPDDDSNGDSTAGVLLLPDMAGKINDVDKVEIITAGNNTVASLIKTPDTWQLRQMGGYRADWPKLQSLLAGLAQARVIEVKTDKPEYYSRLGVEGVEPEDADSVLVKLSVGDQTTGVLIGHQAQGREGRYVRLQDMAASALVDQSLEVAREQLGWVDKRIIDINASEVAEVEILHPEDGRVLITRISADQTDFDLVDLPLDREVQSSWAVNSLASVLSMLDLETVRSEKGVDWSEAVRMRVLLFSGVEIMVDLVEAGDDRLLGLRASHPTAGLNKLKGNDDIARLAVEDVAKRVADINDGVNGWVYGIAGHKYNAMVKKFEDLLKPVESP